MNIVANRELRLVADLIRHCEGLRAACIDRYIGVCRRLVRVSMWTWPVAVADELTKSCPVAVKQTRVTSFCVDAHLVSSAMVVMMMSRDSSDNLYAELLCSCLDLRDGVWIDGGCFLRLVVDEQVRVVVFADGHWYNFHSEVC